MSSKSFILAASLTLSSLGLAAELPAPPPPAKEDIRLLGKLNVNKATRDELMQIPGLDAVKADALLDARSRGPLTSLAAFQLDAEVQSRLTTAGASTLRRIRPLPLEVFTPAPAAATR